MRQPITLTVERGRVTRMACPDRDDPAFREYQKEMLEELSRAPANSQLAEVGLGGNGRAGVSGCIMEDESVRGTCHFCFGDNSRYGGANRGFWHGGTVVVNRVRILCYTLFDAWWGAAVGLAVGWAISRGFSPRRWSAVG